MKKILYIICMAVILTACTENNRDGEAAEKSAAYAAAFLEQSEIGIVIEDKMVKSFDKSTEQIVTTDDQKLFMISTMDNSIYYTLTLDSTLYLEKTLNISYSSKGISELDQGSGSATVVKIDSSDRRYWLWCSSLNIGFIIDFAL